MFLSAVMHATADRPSRCAAAGTTCFSVLSCMPQQNAPVAALQQAQQDLTAVMQKAHMAALQQVQGCLCHVCA